LKTLFYFN